MKRNMIANGFSTGDKGSMIMEYVVVTAFIAAALAIFLNREFFDFSSGFAGELGQNVLAFFQRASGGLSLPIP